MSEDHGYTLNTRLDAPWLGIRDLCSTRPLVGIVFGDVGFCFIDTFRMFDRYPYKLESFWVFGQVSRPFYSSVQACFRRGCSRFDGRKWRNRETCCFRNDKPMGQNESSAGRSAASFCAQWSDTYKTWGEIIPVELEWKAAAIGWERGEMGSSRRTVSCEAIYQSIAMIIGTGIPSLWHYILHGQC